MEDNKLELHIESNTVSEILFEHKHSELELN